MNADIARIIRERDDRILEALQASGSFCGAASPCRGISTMRLTPPEGCSDPTAPQSYHGKQKRYGQIAFPVFAFGDTVRWSDERR